MLPPDTLATFNKRFAVWLDEALATHEVDIVDRGGPFHPDEGATMERAIGEGLVVPLGAGVLHMPGFRLPKTYQLFEYWADRRGRHLSLWRELLIQLGVAAELILDRSMQSGLVALEEQAIRRVGLRRRSGRIPAPRRQAKDEESGSDGIEVMLAVMRPCADLRLIPDPGPGPLKVGGWLASNAEKKYFGLLRRRPSEFLAVAPGARMPFHVTYAAGAAFLDP